MHIVSNVVGRFNNKTSLFETLLAGFPAGTVSGAPKIRAMEIIDELKKTKKIICWWNWIFHSNREFDTCIALRTALIKTKSFMFKLELVLLLIVNLRKNMRKQ